jgi:hypothetical protein
MEVNGYWNDRGAPERVDKVNAETECWPDGATGADEIRD